MKNMHVRGALVALLLAGTAVATTLERLTLEQVSEQSRDIVVATVRSTTAVQGGEPRNLIFTEVEFRADSAWKGSVSSSTFTYRFAGGTIGERTLIVPGVPRFQVGRRYVLFLDPEDAALCPTVGWVQGCYQLRTDAKTGAEFVHDAGGRAVYGFEKGLPVVTPSKDRSRALSLVEFEVEVIGALEAAELRARERERAEKERAATDERPVESGDDDESKSDQPPAPAGEEEQR